MAKKFVISTSRINCYGTRVLTDGIDLGQFRKNPVLLYMHRRGLYGDNTLVLGSVVGLTIEGDQLIGEPDFDMADEFAAQIARKWEAGHLRMCSAGIEIIETSADPADMVAGQTRPTITRCKLLEVSIVDIGANDDALQLYRADGKQLNLAAGVPNDLLPLLNDNNQNPYKMTKFLLALGLAETATEADALAAIAKLQAEAKRSETLELARVESAVDAAVAAGKLTADKRDKFVGLGKTAGFEHLQTALDALSPARKPLDLLKQSGATSTTSLAYGQMSEKQLQELRANNPDEFSRVYEAEFGFAPGSTK